MSSQFIFGVTTAMLTGFSPVAVNYETHSPMSYEETTEKFETVQQFIDAYCSVKKIEFNEETETEVETLELIKTIDRENYEQFLDGYDVYLTFDNEFKKEISEWYFNQNIINENDLGFDVEPRTVTYESLFVDALAMKQQVEEEKNQMPQPQPEPIIPETVEPEYVQPEYVEPEYVQPEYIEPEYVGSEYVEPEYTELETFTPEIVEPEVQEPTPEVRMLQVEEAMEPKLQLQIEEKPAITELLQKPKTSNRVEAFVNAYVSNNQGVIYQSATAYNYEQIISGLPSWNKLSSSDKKEVNTYLKEKVGKSYHKLLQEAQAVKISTVSPKVPTAATSFTAFYSSLCASSFGLLGYILSKYKRL